MKKWIAVCGLAICVGYIQKGAQIKVWSDEGVFTGTMRGSRGADLEIQTNSAQLVILDASTIRRIDIQGKGQVREYLAVKKDN